jgi:hypothetical protein
MLTNNISDFEEEELQKSEIDMESVKRFVDETNEMEQQKVGEGKDENFFMTSSQFDLVIKSLQLLNTNVKVDDVLKNIVDVAVDLTNADRGTLYVV